MDLPFHVSRLSNRSHFAGQMDYIAKNYTIIDTEMLIAAVKTRDPRLLSDRPAYLTFDDGLREHYETVFPLLERRGIHGAFFPAGAASTRSRRCRRT